MLLQPALPNDVDLFVPHKDDIAEAKAAGISWEDNVRDAVASGCFAVIHEAGDALALGGNQGDQCWFVTSWLIDCIDTRQRLAFRKVICEYRDKLLKDYPVLWNYVWVGNQNHMRFLRSIGATFHEEFTESPLTGERFQLFTITGG